MKNKKQRLLPPFLAEVGQKKPTRQRSGAATPAQKVGIRLFMSEERKKVAASAFFPTFVR